MVDYIVGGFSQCEKDSFIHLSPETFGKTNRVGITNREECVRGAFRIAKKTFVYTPASSACQNTTSLGSLVQPEEEFSPEGTHYLGHLHGPLLFYLLKTESRTKHVRVPIRSVIPLDSDTVLPHSDSVSKLNSQFLLIK